VQTGRADRLTTARLAGIARKSASLKGYEALKSAVRAVLGDLASGVSITQLSRRGEAEAEEAFRLTAAALWRARGDCALCRGSELAVRAAHHQAIVRSIMGR